MTLQARHIAGLSESTHSCSKKGVIWPRDRAPSVAIAQIGISIAAEHHGGAVLEIVRRVQDYFRSLVEPFNDLGLQGIAVSNFHGEKPSSTVLNHKSAPLIANAK